MSAAGLRLWTLAAAVVLLAAPAVGGSAEPDARTIMEKNFFASKFKSLKVDSHMALINDKGQKRERRSTNHIKLQPNGIDSKFLVKFSAPTDIKGTSFLQVERSEGEDDLWIYLPALKKSRRLVASNKKDSFVGSDFSYGDILLPRVDHYRHVLLRTEAVDGHDCFVVESTPANDLVRSNSGYSRKVSWVRKDSFLESKVEYFDLSGRLLKTQRITGHELVEPDTQRWLARSREMTNHQNGHSTVLRFDKLDLGVALSDELFTTRFLERE
ncbi:MAG TPA: outer membrane lipoprotein-sorting protein [Steroidobacteraceae bacterium]|nr:outer membrane lipoprotein-sorting protein [Steroidobacteraceae bacterium]